MTTAKPNRTFIGLRELLLIAAVVVAPRLWFLAFTHITYEDSLISLRYAHNLAAGYGLVYNPGERVFGATTPLYVLLLAGLSALPPLDPLGWAKLLCILADGATAAIWYRILRDQTGSRLGALAFVAAFSLSPFIVEISTSGMETPLVLLCVTLAFEAVVRRRGWVLGVWLGLLLLLRLDAAIFAAILLAARAQRERRLPWRDAGVMLAILSPWLLFSLLYYGSIIPNSIPAKLNAYNLHMHSMGRQLSFTLSHFTPFRNGVKESLFAILFLPLALIGSAAALRRHHALCPVLLFFLAEWAFLVLPRTLIFRWYMPPLLLPYYVLGGLGAATLLQWHANTRTRPAIQRVFAVTLVAGLALHTGHWLTAAAWRIWALQSYEETVRKPIGLWLAHNTPPDALISTEPIGYIGYYSGRRILDEVGLVSPGVIPLNRRGAGWFTAVVRSFRPDYIVERPHFLMANKTLNTGVPMFASPAERDWFWTQYRPVRKFACAGSRAYQRAYTFVILKRRETAADRRQLTVRTTDVAAPSPVGVKAPGRS
jgi:glycosyl transferase family 87